MDKLKKEIVNGRMLKNNGSWLYCDKCHKTVGYLCYSTYQSFFFEFLCNCGNSGSFYLEYSTNKEIVNSENLLKIAKNRLCCPNDDSPLFSTVKKHLEGFSYSVTCNECYTNFCNTVP